MNLEELLKEWSEVEPDRFRKLNYLYEIYHDSDGAWYSLLTDSLQSHVQQAIEARGWLWGLEKLLHPISAELDKYVGTVAMKPDGKSYELGESDEAAHALLAAYLKAIKQTAEVAG